MLTHQRTLKHFTLGLESSKSTLKITHAWGMTINDYGIQPILDNDLQVDATSTSIQPIPASASTGIPFVPIEFGLRESGSLHAALSVVIPSSMAPGVGGEGQSAPHGSTGDGQLSADASKSIIKHLQAAIELQCHAAGMVCQPIYIRYALRLADGNHAWVSSPVLLMASPYQPCIQITSVAAHSETGKSTASVNFSLIKCHQICYKINGMLAPTLKGRVSGIDIYLSQPIATFDASQAEGARITLYRNVITQSAAFSPGRDNASDSQIFKGHYADIHNPDVFADHYFTNTELAVSSWQLAANPSMESDLWDVSDYFHAAYIPMSEIRLGVEYQPLALSANTLTCLSKRPRLQIDGNEGIRLSNGFSANINGRILVAPSQIMRYQALPLSSMMAASTGSPVVATEVVVWYDSEGTRCRTATQMHNAPNLDAGFPHHLYVANPNAYKIGIKQGDKHWTLPLRRHADGLGAFWRADLDLFQPPSHADSYAENTFDGSDAWAPIKGTVFASLPNNYYVFPASSVSHVFQGDIRGFFGVKRALSQGQSGQFQLYAFADGGVWALSFDKNGICISLQWVAPTTSGFNGACATSNGVAWYADSRITMVEGQKSHYVSLPNFNYQISLWPRLSEAAHVAGCTWPNPAPVSYISTEASGYWLCAMDINGAVLYAYNPASGYWVGNSTGDAGCLLTEAFYPDADYHRCTLHEVFVRGAFNEGEVMMCVYGTTNKSQWHLLGTSTTHRCFCFDGSPYRAFRLALFAKKRASLAIESLSIAYEARFKKHL